MEIIELAEVRKKLEKQKEDDSFSSMSNDEQIETTLQNITDTLILFSEKIELLMEAQNQTTQRLAEVAEGVLDTARNNIRTDKRLNEFADSTQEAFNKVSARNDEVVDAFNILNEQYNEKMPLVMEKIIELYGYVNK